MIRVSGRGSVELLSPLFSRGEKLRLAPGRTLLHGWIIGPGLNDGQGPSRLDEVMVAVYRAPASYTGEDGAEISCHGGFAALKAVLGALKKGGFRDALPGEFSFRAFMNGKLDLTRAESVMELVSASTDRGRARALGRLSGALALEIGEVKTLLLDALAGAELLLDYSEEDGAPPGPEGSGLPDRALAEEALARLRGLADSYRLERLYQEGALAVIAGRPNAGKSSLFNRLIKEDRSIVTGSPGTTRDWIEAHISLGGAPLRLADTAGLRESPPGAGEAERLGIARSRELIARADILLYLVDGAEGPAPEDRAFLREESGGRVIALWNKSDRAPLGPETAAALEAEFPGCPWLSLSAKTGEGLPALERALEEALVKEAPAGEGPGLGTPRQKELVDAALAALEEALSLDSRGEPLDLTAPALREAVNALGEITGEVSTAELLETMFSRFCVGK